MARKHRPSGIVPVPEALRARLHQQLGPEADDLLLALDGPSPVSIRLNPAKSIAFAGTAIPWCSNGRYLAERPVFTLDPLFHAGCYYVQEASSMLLEQAFLASGLSGKDLAALDLCAAPGGKSTHLAALLSPGSLLVSNEVDRRRQPALLENLWKWGREGHVITGDTPERSAALGPLFDLVLVDAPCSGEGMMRKDPFARQQWSPRLVEQCAITQANILHHAWEALRPGGVLIYSTCTWSEAEDDAAVALLLQEHDAEVVPLPDLTAHGLLRTRHGLVAYPHRVQGEGFFIAALRKPGTASVPTEHVSGWQELEHDGVVHRIPAQWADTVGCIARNVRTLSAGTPWHSAGPDGRHVPHAASAYLGRPIEGAADLELDREQALTFLRGEALRADAPSGQWRRVTHLGHGLGFVRGAGNRWNNQLPSPWRIRMR
jgi:16S rRNA C967 or C1407 C5-methylase (RsmB/RsmF family)